MNTADRTGTTLTGTPPATARYWLLAALVLVVALLAGFVPRWQARAALREQTAALAVPSVTVIAPRAAARESVLVLPGEVRPLVEAPIYARTSGYVKRWLVDLGAAVKAGDLLAEIDAPEVDQQLLQARAQLGEANANAHLAKTTAARFDTLRKTAAVSAQDKDEKDADSANRDATVEAARANVRRLEDLKNFQRVTAPFDGVITERSTDVGQLITAGNSQPLFRLAQPQTLRVFIRVPQSAAHQIATGQSADVGFTEIPGRAFEAKVVRTAGAIDPASRTLLVELQLDNADGKILAGSHAEVRAKIPAPETALLLPANTLLYRAEGTQVGIVGENGRVELRTVKLGRDFGHDLEIRDGLKPEDRVILNPSDSLAAGTTVRLAEPAAVLEKK